MQDAKLDIDSELGLISYINIREQLSKYKYIISVDGNSWANRLPTLLLGGGVIFKQESSYYQWWYSLLTPYTHYIPIKHDFSDLIDRIKWAREHDAQVKNISENARKFALNRLRADDVYCYWLKLLEKYTTISEPPTMQSLNNAELVTTSEVLKHWQQCFR